MIAQLAGICLALFAAAEPTAEARISLPRPGEREFVRDHAGLLSAQDKTEIVELCDRLLTDKATPIIVLTINSMGEHGGDGMRIETFARLLFDQWEIGHAELNAQTWNTGILLLISKGDRKARIELGAGWHREKDQLCKEIMDQQIIPRFKQQDFSGGMKAGVVALNAMARELKLPAAAPSGSQSLADTPPWVPIAWLVFLALAVFTVVSLFRSGSSGWAWVFWGLAFSMVGMLLYSLANSSNHRSSGGGSFGGGSFGGGFSGGGGASGDW